MSMENLKPPSDYCSKTGVKKRDVGCTSINSAEVSGVYHRRKYHVCADTCRKQKHDAIRMTEMRFMMRSSQSLELESIMVTVTMMNKQVAGSPGDIIELFYATIEDIGKE